MNPLHIVYRPRTFDEYIGNEVMIKSVKSALKRTQTYLFFGSRGCGKTTLARLIAHELKINKNDIYEIDAADKTSVDDARQLKSTVSLAPLSGDKKIYIIEVNKGPGIEPDARTSPEFKAFSDYLLSRIS